MSGTAKIGRRAVLAALASLVVAPASAAQPRIAAIDWAMLETLLAIGIDPVAATELLQYRQIAVEPEVPHTVADLGLRGTPNFELLRLVRPDHIVISNFYEYQRPALERVAPVISLPVYQEGGAPYAMAERAASALGDTFGHKRAAAELIETARSELASARDRLGGATRPPMFVISLGDARHFRAFGRDSMFGDVLERLGFANAWIDPTSYSAAAPIGLEALARRPDASIVVVAPVPPDVAWSLGENAIWQALPAVRAGRVATLAPINHFGGLPAARRFARFFASAIETTGGA